MRCSIPLQQRSSFHLDMIAQLHVYHPWHWRNVPFSESPHKTLVYKSLAEISPLAKLPSQAVDFQTPYLQSAAQRGPSHRGITRVGEEASPGSGCLAESVTHRSFHSSLHLWHRAHISATFKTGEPATPSPFRTSLRDEGSLICPSQPGVNMRMSLWIAFCFWLLAVVEAVGELQKDFLQRSLLSCLSPLIRWRLTFLHVFFKPTTPNAFFPKFFIVTDEIKTNLFQ